MVIKTASDVERQKLEQHTNQLRKDATRTAGTPLYISYIFWCIYASGELKQKTTICTFKIQE